MLNGDVLTDLDLTAQIAQHEATGATGTLALVPVPDPSSYGLVRLREDNAVEEFLEKPSRRHGARHEPHLGRRLRPRALGARPHRARHATSRSSARSGRRSSTRASTATSTTARTGSTSARPSATCRRRSTSSRATSARTSSAKLGDGYLVGRSVGRVDGRAVPPAIVGAGATIAEGAHVGSLAVLGETSASAPARSSSARSCSTARGSARTASCATASSAPAPASATAARSSAARCSARASSSAPTTSIARGARLFPGMEVPDGGLAFSDVTELRLDAEAIAAVDHSDMLADIVGLPEHLRDALWKVESANLKPWDSPGGLVVAGMGGSAVGGALARAMLGDHASRPMLASRQYGLPAWTTPDTTVLCASYSGNTEETLACYEAAGALGARAWRSCSGGQARRAGARRRRAGDPGRRRLSAARRRRVHDRRRARGRLAVRRRPADGRRDRRRRRPPRAARRRVGRRRRRGLRGQGARARRCTTASRSSPARA